MNHRELIQQTQLELAQAGVDLPDGLNLIQLFNTYGSVLRRALAQGNDVVLLGLGALSPYQNQRGRCVGFRPSNILKNSLQPTGEHHAQDTP